MDIWYQAWYWLELETSWSGTAEHEKRRVNEQPIQANSSVLPMASHLLSDVLHRQQPVKPGTRAARRLQKKNNEGTYVDVEKWLATTTTTMPTMTTKGKIENERKSVRSLSLN